MENGSEPLLSSNFGVSKTSNNSVLISSAKWVLRILMWVIFVAWVLIIFAYPTEFGSQLFQKWIHATNHTVFGITGSIFLLLSGPVILIAILAVVYIVLSGIEDFHQTKSSKHARVRLWTFPVLVNGPLGVVSATEFIGIVLFVVYILWALYVYTLRNLSIINSWQISAKEESIWLIELTGLRLGVIGLFCMVFLFLPISRGSVMLRLIDIPFEHATRYHVWLGHLTMLLFTLHGLLYVIGWAMRGDLMRELLEWKEIGIANLAGVISLLAGLLMWMTSLRPVRRWNFELFFYTHQLYVVFVVFLAFHVGDFLFSISAGAIFLFILDRFLRFCQSRKTVDILSVKSLPCGTVEMVLSKPASLKYNALSFVFLQVRELSWLQWHPFSVSSSPLDGKQHLAVLIKVLGGWTAKLKENIEKICEADSRNDLSRLNIASSVEGPYGHESPYHLMYENLVLVAGGIGISPFLAILRDILHRINDGKPCLPKNILIVWAIKKTDELPLLSVSDLESICPYISDKLNLDIQIYVTRESEPNLEEGRILGATTSSLCPISKACPMSVLVGTGDNVWSGLYVITSFLGFVILLYVSQVFYVNPFHVSSWWYKGLLFVVCMVASVVIFGGTVIVFWHRWDREISNKEHETNQTTVETLQLNGGLPSYKDSHQKGSGNFTTIHYGSRPDFREIFDPVRKSWGDVDIGVIICGPPTLQSSVAREIRSQNLLRETSQPVFHYNSHSFDL